MKKTGKQTAVRILATDPQQWEVLYTPPPLGDFGRVCGSLALWQLGAVENLPLKPSDHIEA